MFFGFGQPLARSLNTSGSIVALKPPLQSAIDSAGNRARTDDGPKGV